jgi:small-conductance mechanosensitive channel
MLSQILKQLRNVPEYLIALKAALAILASGLPIYAGIWYFTHKRHLKAHWAFTFNFVGAIALCAGLAFLLASPLAGLIHPTLLQAYLFITCIVTSLSVVAFFDLFLVQHYISNVKRIYISPPLRTIIKMSVFCLALLPILHYVLHFNPLTLVAIPTIATAGLALALQDTLKTFIAGVALGKIIRLGEWIRYQEEEGCVVDVNWARTVLRTLEGNYVFIPNTQLQTGVFTNFTTNQQASRILFKVGASYDSSPAKVKQVLLDCISGTAGISASLKPSVYVLEYASSAITYGVYYWLEDYAQKLAVQDDIATRIWNAFSREKIEIPFPTRTIHLRPNPQETNPVH